MTRKDLGIHGHAPIRLLGVGSVIVTVETIRLIGIIANKRGISVKDWLKIAINNQLRKELKQKDESFDN